MARLVPLMAVLLALAPDAIAQSKAIGRYNDWRVYTEGEGRNMVCFAAVEASDMAPKAAEATSQPSLRVGYTLRKDLAPAAIIGRDRFPMYAAGQEAFFPDDREKPLLDALKKGKELRVEAASVKDARTAYHFSLKGSRDAIDKAKALCK